MVPDNGDTDQTDGWFPYGAMAGQDDHIASTFVASSRAKISRVVLSPDFFDNTSCITRPAQQTVEIVSKIIKRCQQCSGKLVPLVLADFLKALECSPHSEDGFDTILNAAIVASDKRHK